MTPRLFYRIAAILILAFAAGHTLLFSYVNPAWGVDSLVHSMQTTQFDAYGSERTYWDFFLGFGYVVAALLVLTAVIVWQLGNLPPATLSKMRISAWALCAAFTVITILAVRYFFIMPIVLNAATAVSLGIAAWLSDGAS